MPTENLHQTPTLETMDPSTRYLDTQVIGGRSPRMQRLFSILDYVIPAGSNVILEGERGTEKELLVQTIHTRGPRRNRPLISFQAINLESLNEKIEPGSTLFLEEVSELSDIVRARLIQLMCQDIRIILASTRNRNGLESEADLREILFYQFNFVKIEIPALRDRKEDLDLLIDSFLESIRQKNDGKRQTVTPEVREAFHGYHWPDNLKELHDTLESLILKNPRRRTIKEKELPATFRQLQELAIRELEDLETARNEFLKNYIEKLLRVNHGNVSKAALCAGISRQTLYQLMRKLEGQ